MRNDFKMSDWLRGPIRRGCGKLTIFPACVLPYLCIIRASPCIVNFHSYDSNDTYTYFGFLSFIWPSERAQASLYMQIYTNELSINLSFEISKLL